MSLLRSRTVAVLGAATLLVAGAAGGGYAAGQITGRDIKDGTVTSSDVRDASLRAKDLAPATVTSLAPRLLVSRAFADKDLTDTVAAVHSITVPPGTWLVTVSALAYSAGAVGELPWANCDLSDLSGSASETTTTVPAGDFYSATLGTQLEVTASSAREVAFECTGVNATIRQVQLTALEVGSITDVS